jgi:hypothetical protein
MKISVICDATCTHGASEKSDSDADCGEGEADGMEKRDYYAACMGGSN